MIGVAFAVDMRAVQMMMMSNKRRSHATGGGRVAAIKGSSCVCVSEDSGKRAVRGLNARRGGREGGDVAPVAKGEGECRVLMARQRRGNIRVASA